MNLGLLLDEDRRLADLALWVENKRLRVQVAIEECMRIKEAKEEEEPEGEVPAMTFPVGMNNREKMRQVLSDLPGGTIFRTSHAMRWIGWDFDAAASCQFSQLMTEMVRENRVKRIRKGKFVKP